MLRSQWNHTFLWSQHTEHMYKISGMWIRLWTALTALWRKGKYMDMDLHHRTKGQDTKEPHIHLKSLVYKWKNVKSDREDLLALISQCNSDIWQRSSPIWNQFARLQGNGSKKAKAVGYSRLLYFDWGLDYGGDRMWGVTQPDDETDEIIHSNKKSLVLIMTRESL